MLTLESPSYFSNIGGTPVFSVITELRWLRDIHLSSECRRSAEADCVSFSHWWRRSWLWPAGKCSGLDMEGLQQTACSIDRMRKKVTSQLAQISTCQVKISTRNNTFMIRWYAISTFMYSVNWRHGLYILISVLSTYSYQTNDFSMHLTKCAS